MEKCAGYSYRKSREQKKKFVRYKEGAEIYSIGLTRFQEIAKRSGAVYKVGNMCLVNTDILDKYLEKYRMENEQ